MFFGFSSNGVTLVEWMTTLPIIVIESVTKGDVINWLMSFIVKNPFIKHFNLQLEQFWNNYIYMKPKMLSPYKIRQFWNKVRTFQQFSFPPLIRHG
jgi:hypothetical protein